MSETFDRLDTSQRNAFLQLQFSLKCEHHLQNSQKELNDRAVS